MKTGVKHRRCSTKRLSVIERTVDNRFYIRRGKVVETGCEVGEKEYSLAQEPPFTFGPIRKYSTWKAFLGADVPPPPVGVSGPPWSDIGKRGIVVEDNNPWPTFRGKPPSPDALISEIGVKFKVSSSRARRRGQKNDQGADILRTGFLITVAVIALLSVILGFLVVSQVMGNQKNKHAALTGLLIGITAPVQLSNVSKRKKARPTSSSKGRRYETVLVYDNPHPWRVALPLDVLVEHLDPAARCVPDTEKPKYIGAAFGGLVGAALFLLGFGALLHSYLAAIILGGPIAGLVIGAVLGFAIGPTFGPKPFWMVHRVVGEDKKVIIVPIYHSKLMLDYWATYAERNLYAKLKDAAMAWLEKNKKPATGELVENVVSQMKSAELSARAVRAYRADQMKAVEEAKDREALYTTTNKRWRKIAIMGILGILVCVLGLLILFGIAMAGN